MSKQNIQPGKKVCNEEDEQQKIKVCLCKQEMLDTIELMLQVSDENQGSRPIMSENLKLKLKQIGGGKLPKDVEDENNEHEGRLDLFVKKLEEKCKERFPNEFQRLNDNNHGIVYMILKYGRNTDFVRLNKMLDLYEMFWDKKTISEVKAAYMVGQELRNDYVLDRLGIKEEDIKEIDPETVDMEKVQKEHPHVFQ